MTPATDAAVYHLFGGLLLECASDAALRDIRDKGLLEALAEVVSDADLREALLRMRAALASDAAIVQLRADHARLFLGAGRDGVAPWESVHRSEERLVWQGPAIAVLHAYARAGLGYEEMTAVPPDHVGRELLFLATLAVEAAATDDPARAASLRDARRAFLDEHVLAWVPAFLGAVREKASTEFYRALADGLLRLLDTDRECAAA
ncbi:MAG: molecular chaperone TorD family protein [Myxococcales bacterium]|nr:molecular chaperone TorD family protein [Myxococcales bacterium]